jgi:hypothetical protein
MANLWPTCPPCNHWKRDKLLLPAKSQSKADSKHVQVP